MNSEKNGSEYKVGNCHPPLEHRIKPGQKLALGHGPWKKVRKWANVYREVFDLLMNNPEELERRIGIKLPEGIKKKDCQALIVLQEVKKALSGELAASGEVKTWMDGKPKETISMEKESGINLNDLPDDMRKEVLQELLDQEKKSK